MPLDEKILADVDAARTRLERLEDETYEARASLHQAIRRLHAAGASMREIATSLGMSHQRIHQIIGTDGIVEVEPSAVVDVSRLPAAGAGVAVTAGEDRCSFCGAPRRELDKLLAAPGPVFICGGCVGRANLAVQHRAAPAMRTVPLAEDATCSFCGNSSGVGGIMAEAESGSPRICARCTETSRKLVAKEEPAKPMGRRVSKVRCSFCNVSQADARKLIAGPRVYICGDCVPATREALVRDEPVRGPRQVTLRPAAPADTHACSFCGKSPSQVQGLVKGGRARICDECLALCEDILEEEAR